jgi:HEAT repeat protein
MNLQRKMSPTTAQTTQPQATSDDVRQMLSEILGEGVDVHRCLAAQALGRIGDAGAVDPLIKALLDEDEDVRTDAAAALAQLSDARSSEQLLENLIGDPCTDVKLTAIDTLAKLQDKAVIPWLRRVVKGRDEEIAWDEDEFYDSGWDDWVDVQIKAVNALATLKANEAVPDIVAAMRDENAQDMTEAGFKALARMGEPGIEALVAFLDEDSTRLRRRAAAALASIGHESAREPVSRALADPAPVVRMAAMRALAARAPTDDRLAQMFEDSDDAIRSEAVRLFGSLCSDHLPALLSGNAAEVQIAVLSKIEAFPASETLLEEVRSKLMEESAPLVAAAAKALGVIAPEQALDDLTELLGDPARPVEARLGALQGLAGTVDDGGGDDVVRVLVNAMQDDARPLRLEAMSALARIAKTDPVWPNEAGAALLSALSTEVVVDETGVENVTEPLAEPVRVSVEETGELGADVDTNEELASEAEDDSFPTSTIAAIMENAPEAKTVKALQMPGEGIELTPVDMERLALARNIKGKKRMAVAPKVNPHEDVRRFAARVLGDIGQPDVASALAFVLTDKDNEIRMAAADSLARIGDQAVSLPANVSEMMLVVMKMAKPELKLLLTRALAASADERVDDVLKMHLSDDDSFIRTEAVRALQRRGRVGPEIDALLGDADSSVRLSAAEAVTRTGDDDVVGKLVDFAFSFEGCHGVQAAHLLRDLDVMEANGRFLEILNDSDQKRTWSVAINALAELNVSR